MTLRFSWDWQAAPEVKAPELAATWSRLRIDLAGATATLVEERSSGHGVRKSLDVPTYPLAEWIAFNWWSARAPAARPDNQGLRLTRAGDGFPWPDLTLRPGPGYIAASLHPLDRDPYFVRFLSSLDAVLDADATIDELSRFVDATVRRLEEEGITGTPLQDEWRAITISEQPEEEFCLVAAALGLDPYDMDADETRAVLGMGDSVGSGPLRLDLASGVDLGELPAAVQWLDGALRSLGKTPAPRFHLERIGLPFGERVRPWEVGFERARRLRMRLGFEPTTPIVLEDLASVVSVDAPAPPGIAGLVGAGADTTTLVLGSGVSRTTQRFSGARALGRRSFDDREGEILLTATRRQYAEQVERAFAAEFLAPAAGVAELLEQDYTDTAIEKLALQYDVNPRVIEHQVENQLAT